MSTAPSHAQPSIDPPARNVAAVDTCPPPRPMWSHFATTPARYADIRSSDDDVPK